MVNYSLDGKELNVYMQFSVLPGHEHDWSRVQVALIDITARKKAEAYLEYLGKHDVVTKLYNRSFYVEELNRLERKGPWPVTMIMMDLDGLKVANDQLGHSVGDALLRRLGEVLNKVVDKLTIQAARMVSAAENIRAQIEQQGQQIDDEKLMRHFILPHFETAMAEVYAKVFDEMEVDEDEVDDAKTFYIKAGAYCTTRGLSLRPSVCPSVRLSIL